MIKQILAQIEKDFRKKLFWLRHGEAVKSHQGEFLKSDLQQITLAAPCIRFTYGGISEVKQSSGAQAQGQLDLVAILIAKDCELKLEADVEFYRKEEIITMMLDSLLPFIIGNSFNLAGLENSVKPQVRPLYRGESSGSNISIWALKWGHTFVYNQRAGQSEQANDLRQGSWKEF